MKLVVLLEMEVSKTMAETIQRAGFQLVPDGTSLQVKVANAPPVPQRKTKVAYVTNPSRSLKDILDLISTEPVTAPDVEAAAESK